MAAGSFPVERAKEFLHRIARFSKYSGHRRFLAARPEGRPNCGEFAQGPTGRRPKSLGTLSYQVSILCDCPVLLVK
jgi:hypothetical protein